MKKTGFILACLAGLFVFTGCATQISYNVERPAKLDLRGADKVAVLPFQTPAEETTTYFFGLAFSTSKADTPSENVARLLTYKLQTALLDENYFKVVGSRAVQTAMENGNPSPCDVYLTGTLSNFKTSIESRIYTDNNGTSYYRYFRKANGTVSYQVISADTHEVFAIRVSPLSKESYEESKREDLPSAEELLEDDLDELVTQIVHELQPYVITKYLTLMEDKSKDPEMEKADKFAKNSSFEEAEKTFLAVYKSSGSKESGYNAALCQMAQGKLEDALALMTEVYSIYADKKAYSAIKDIKTEIAYAENLEEQINARRAKLK